MTAFSLIPSRTARQRADRRRRRL